MAREDDDQIEIELDDPSDFRNIPHVDGKASDEDVKIDVVEEKPKRKRGQDAQEGLETLREQLAREKEARLAAERRANEMSVAAYSATAEAHDSNLHLVTNAIGTVQQTNDILKANYREAMSVGDFDRAADIQTELASNQAKLLQLEQGRQALEERPRPQAPQPYIADPVEALASQLSPRSAEWIRSHPEYATDGRLYQKMLAAHNLAMADGLQIDSDDYFYEIESTLRIDRSERRRDYDDPTKQAAQVTQRRTAPPAAPVSRSGSNPGTRPNRVTLTKAEVEMAQMMGMTPEEYGRNKLSLQKEGKLN
jgi:hypothetical protein